MSIKGWILFGIVILAGSASAGLAAETQAPSLQESYANLEKAIQSTKENTVRKTGGVSRWPELERFQSSLWRAMALDPSVIAAVPISEVPKELFAHELNQDLENQLASLKKSPVSKELGIEAEFSQYLGIVQNIISLRKMRRFPEARAIAKRGVLDQRFEPIAKHLWDGDGRIAPIDPWNEVDESMKAVKETVNAKEGWKKEIFNTGNNFIWYAAIALFGFMLGLTGAGLQPKLFNKVFEGMFSGPNATTHGRGNPLDYAQWLREFEEILSRLKSSQLSHERRIEDLVSQSDRIAQQIVALSSDTRIKNEANLEFRMGSIVRGIHHQIELGQKMQSGDRAQINTMLEHCLILCDAIENQAVHFDRKTLEAPPELKSA
jgi:hypothetical protein